MMQAQVVEIWYFVWWNQNAGFGRSPAFWCDWSHCV